MRKQLIFIFIFISFFSFSQQGIVNGKVLSEKDKQELLGANILNLNSVWGTSTDEKGAFKMKAEVNDTLLISYVGFESIKVKVTNDLLKMPNVEILLNERPEELKNVVVKSTELIGVLEIDVKRIPELRFQRIQLNGINQSYGLGISTNSSSLLSKIFNPVDAVYNLFGEKPKRLKKLKKLKKEDKLRDILADKYDRVVMLEYLNMNRDQLTKLLKKCNHSEYFIEKASDLQLIEAILNCYETYKADKKGKIGLNKLPE